jgi:hypothetical protein
VNLQLNANVNLKMLLFPTPQEFNTFNTFNTFDHVAVCRLHLNVHLWNLRRDALRH